MGVAVTVSHMPGAAPYRSDVWATTPIECDTNLGYWRGLSQAWDSDDTLVNVEHDMECDDRLIGELVDCPSALCTHAYLLYWPSTHSSVAHYAHRTGGAAAGFWIREGATSAQFSGIGFCKIRPEARVRPLMESHWSLLDVQVNAAVDGDWCVHWPGVEHWHTH